MLLSQKCLENSEKRARLLNITLDFLATNSILDFKFDVIPEVTASRSLADLTLSSLNVIFDVVVDITNSSFIFI